MARLSEAGYQAPVPGGSSPESECEGGKREPECLEPLDYPKGRCHHRRSGWQREISTISTIPMAFGRGTRGLRASIIVNL